MEDPKPLTIGDTVLLMTGSFSPPTMNHYRAVEALMSRPEWKHIWIAPIYSNDDHVKGLTTTFVVDLCANGKQISCCTIGLDKKLSSTQDVTDWVRKKFPYLNFRIAVVDPDPCPKDSEKTVFVKLGVKGDVVPDGADLIALESFSAVPADLLERIKNGSDESRNIPPPVWNYIQRHKLYRFRETK